MPVQHTVFMQFSTILWLLAIHVYIIYVHHTAFHHIWMFAIIQFSITYACSAYSFPLCLTVFIQFSTILDRFHTVFHNIMTACDTGFHYIWMFTIQFSIKYKGSTYSYPLYYKCLPYSFPLYLTVFIQFSTIQYCFHTVFHYT